MYSLNPVLALMLAISMFIFPAGSAIVSTDIPPTTVAIEYAGETVTLGLTDTTDDESAFFMLMDDSNLYLSESTGVATDGEDIVRADTGELQALLSHFLRSVPMPSEVDLNALSVFGRGLLTSISPEAFSFTTMGEGFTVVVDLDELLDNLDTAIPTLLTDYADTLNPTIRKYTTALMGETVDADQLAALWRELELSQVQTGLTMQLSIVPQRNGSVTFLGHVSGANFIGSVSESGFNVRIIMPDGTTYHIDTADFITLLGFFSELPDAITADAYSYEESTVRDAEGYAVRNIVITFDSQMLARDLNNGVAQALTDNADEINALLEKYRPWLALIDADMATSLSAASLADVFSEGLITLPEFEGSVTISDSTNGITTVTGSADAFCGDLALNGTIFSRPYTTAGSLTLTLNSRYDPMVCTLSFAQDYDALTATFNCNEPLFDLFNSISISTNTFYRDTSLRITTDTDAFRFSYDEDEALAFKLGELEGHLTIDDDAFQAGVTMPEFYANVAADEESFSLDSTVLGLDFTNSDDGLVINGYTGVEDERILFGLNMNQYGSSIHAYINGLDDSNYSLTLSGGMLLIDVDGTVYTITADAETLTVTSAGRVLFTVTSELSDDYNTVILRVYTGSDTTAAPLCTITIDTDADAIELPQGGVLVDAEDFAEFVHDHFN